MHPFPSAALLALAASSFASWTPLSTPFPGVLEQVVPVSSGLFALSEGRPFRTRDAGATWELAAEGLPPSALLAAVASKGDTIVAFGAGAPWRSCDGGSSWTAWGEGFELAPDAIPYLSLVQGDSAWVLAQGATRSARTWKRTPHGPWREIPGSTSSQARVVWTGRAFTTGGSDGGVQLLAPSGSSWTEAGEDQPELSDATWFRGSRWAVSRDGNYLLRSTDSGTTWEMALADIPWTSHLSSSATGLFCTGKDSAFRVESGAQAEPRGFRQPESYGYGLLDLGGRWMFLGERSTWNSSDSGRTWSRAHTPPNGLVSGILPTAKGFAAQSASDPTLAALSSDLRDWIPLALPAGMRAMDLDTAAGTLHALGSGQLWTFDPSGWTRDSLTLRGYEGPTSIAFDGTRLWTADSKGLYGRSPSARSWALLDSTTGNPFAVTIRHWKGALWTGGGSSTAPLAARKSDGTWSHPDLSCGRVFALAPTPAALWVGTDSGLFRTLDGTRFERLAPDARMPRGSVFALAALGDTVAASQTACLWVRACDRISVSVSTDGGSTWNLDTTRAVFDFGFGPRGLVAGPGEGGLSAWGAGTESVHPAGRVAPSSLRWRPGLLEWSASDAIALEILDPRGRILSRTDLPEGMRAIVLAPANSLRVARLLTRHGAATVAVPPLR